MITPMQAADAINYLFAAQAISVVDNQDAVWADYINDAIPDCQPTDLLPACREAVRTWAQDQRAWRIDTERYTRAIRTVRHRRVEEATGGRPLLPDGIDDPEVELEWRRAARAALIAGAPRDQAEAAAWDRINSRIEATS